MPIKIISFLQASNGGIGKFQVLWYDKWKWLEYSESANTTYCFFCRHFGDNAFHSNEHFRTKGFANFDKGPEKFNKHEKSEAHKRAMTAYALRQATSESVSSQLDSERAKKVLNLLFICLFICLFILLFIFICQFACQVAANRLHLKRVIECVAFLAKLNLPFRAHDESDQSKKKGNFLELVAFRGNDVPEFAQSCQKKLSYVSPKIQNELIDLLALQILGKIKPVSFYSIIADETTDRSKSEQISVNHF